MARGWSGAKAQTARKMLMRTLPAPCCRCGGEVSEEGADWDVDHIPSRVYLDESDWLNPEYLRVAHSRCNRGAGARLGHERKKAGRGGHFAPESPTPRPRDLRNSPQDGSKAQDLQPETTQTDIEPRGLVGWFAQTDQDVWGLEPPGPKDNWPRLMTARHPLAVGTYGPEFVAWADANTAMHPKRTTGLRWFQKLIAYRLLEHDAEGNLLWATALLTISRQSGKSWFLRALITWRIEQYDRWQEPQTVVSLAHKRVAAEEVWRPAARHYRHSEGYVVRFSNGQETIETPDGGRWLLAAANEGAGVSFSLSMAVVDEAWSIATVVVDEYLHPTMAESESPQMLLVSTAGDSDSHMMKMKRESAIATLDEPEDMLLVEWSAPPDAAIDDRRAWRQASGYWDDRREKFLEATYRTLMAATPPNIPAWKMQYLNQWVAQRTRKRPLVFPEWVNCPRAPKSPGRGCIVAIDESRDGSHYGIAVYSPNEAALHYREVLNLTAAMRMVDELSPDNLVVGLTLKTTVASSSWPSPIGYGSRETRVGTPLLIEAVKRRAVSHEHTDELALSAGGAVVRDVDSGLVLSPAQSETSILPLKLFAWLLVYDRAAVNSAPAIWS